MSYDLPTALPTGLVARPATRDDVPSLLALARRYEQELTGTTVLAEADVVETFASEKSGESTAVVVVLDGVQTVAHYLTKRDGAGRWAASVVVALPVEAQRRADLIAEGIRWAENTSVTLSTGEPSLRITHWCWPQDRAYRRALAEHGYHEARAFAELSISLAGRTPQTPNPDVHIRRADLSRLDGDDARAVYDVISQSFRDHWDYTERTFSDWMAYRAGKPHFQPAEWYLAEIDGAPVGATIHHDGFVADHQAAHIDNLGTLRWARGRGVARALLEHSFSRAEQRGLEAVTLYVDTQSPTGADRLYESVGMRPLRTGEEWQKHVDIHP